MLKKTIAYEDYDGNPRTETLYFNLNSSELVKLMYSKGGKFEDYVESIIEAKDVETLYDLFVKIVDMSYGKKSMDGRQFMKSPEILADFKSTLAYDKLIMQLATDDKAAADFVNGILPPKTVEQAKDEVSKNPNLIAVPGASSSEVANSVLQNLTD